MFQKLWTNVGENLVGREVSGEGVGDEVRGEGNGFGSEGWVRVGGGARPILGGVWR